MTWLTRQGRAIGCRSPDTTSSTIEPAEASAPAIPASRKSYAVALDEARRGFDSQAAQFGRVRASVGALLGYGGVAFSVLVVASGESASLLGRWLLIGAAGCFALLAMVAVWAMWPARVIPGPDPTQVVAWIDGGFEADQVDRDLALHYDNAYARNAKVLRSRNVGAIAALLLFAVMILLLVARLIGV